MIEKILKKFLKEKLKMDVFLEYPKNYKKDDFILIEKTSSSNENKLLSATFAIQSYGKSVYEAALNNEKVKEAMVFFVNDKRIGSVKLNSDYNFTDLEMKRSRYQAVFDIYYYKIKGE